MRRLIFALVVSASIASQASAFEFNRYCDTSRTEIWELVRIPHGWALEFEDRAVYCSIQRRLNKGAELDLLCFNPAVPIPSGLFELTLTEFDAVTARLRGPKDIDLLLGPCDANAESGIGEQ